MGALPIAAPGLPRIPSLIRFVWPQLLVLVVVIVAVVQGVSVVVVVVVAVVLVVVAIASVLVAVIPAAIAATIAAAPPVGPSVVSSGLFPVILDPTIPSILIIAARQVGLGAVIAVVPSPVVAALIGALTGGVSHVGFVFVVAVARPFAGEALPADTMNGDGLLQSWLFPVCKDLARKQRGFLVFCRVAPRMPQAFYP
eukprot:CAMPEP_0206543156 /NCGR_PEP_ID=MMETSP0325_2-20121206/10654_1 /ASSEMBLY_ACC=CAM_ASM_000347 /TAXON_ID=2866 /ORGANISM="Crypthecodinium cohnii, Strain Seligo" /LENGTH=197 /DNA_ID=CAMNT_0054041459 /DNA_START=333 /DNA_END=926 /DNA_ORIENTATION=-